MLGTLQNSFQYLHFKTTVRFQLIEHIQNALSGALAMLRIGNLTWENRRACAFFIAKLIYAARLDDSSKVSVSIHGFAVNTVQITITRLIEFNLRMKACNPSHRQPPAHNTFFHLNALLRI